MWLGAGEPLCVFLCLKPYPIPHEDGLEGIFIGAGTAGHGNELGHPFGSHLQVEKQLWAQLHLDSSSSSWSCGRQREAGRELGTSQKQLSWGSGLGLFWGGGEAQDEGQRGIKGEAQSTPPDATATPRDAHIL